MCWRCHHVCNITRCISQPIGKIGPHHPLEQAAISSGTQKATSTLSTKPFIRILECLQTHDISVEVKGLAKPIDRYKLHGDPTFVILKYQTWLDTSKFEDKILGAIVKEFLQPTNNYVPDSPLQYTTHDPVENAFTDFVLDTSASTGHEISGSLGSIAGVSFHGSKDASVHLKGKLIRCKRLQQHDRFWSELKKDPTFKAASQGGWLSPSTPHGPRAWLSVS
jgi:hypothetical protein